MKDIGFYSVNSSTIQFIDNIGNIGNIIFNFDFNRVYQLPIKQYKKKNKYHYKQQYLYKYNNYL